MNGYLLDTNIISEYNRADSPHPGVVQWMKATPATLQYLSVLTLGEIEKGILLLDEGKRRREIQQWFENDLPTRFAGRILAIDKDVASKWARFIAPLLKQGRPLPTIDSLLAATALAHDLTFVTPQCEAFRRLECAVAQSLGSAMKRRRAGVCELLGALTPDSDTGYGNIRRRFQSESKARSSAEAWLGRVSPALPKAHTGVVELPSAERSRWLGEAQPAKVAQGLPHSGELSSPGESRGK